MSPQDFLGKLPSFDELLDHPRVRDATDRWNRSAAAARVRTAMSSFSKEASRRAEAFAGASPSELLDRFVNSLGQPTAPEARGAINASGRLWGEDWAGPPLPGAAIEALHRAAGSPRLVEAPSLSAPVLCRLASAEACQACNSPAAAVGLAIEQLAAGQGGVIVARSDVRDLPPGVKLAEECERSGAPLVDVGDASGASVEEYLEAIERLKSDGARRPVVYRNLEPGVSVERLSTSELATAIHKHGALLIEDLGGAPPCEGLPIGDTAHAFRSIESTIAAKADLVVAYGAGLIGGPGCGLLVGSAGLIEEIAASPGARQQQADPLVDTALAATLELFFEPNQLRFEHPLYELIDAPIENLRTRAERLAPQIATAAGIASADAVELSAQDSGIPLGLSSWGIAVTAEQGADALLQELSLGKHCLIAGTRQEAVLIDLRTVFARQDAALLAAFGLEDPASENSAEDRSPA